MTDATPEIDFSRLRIARIPSKDCVRRFSCGEQQIDNWVQNKAYKFHHRNRARVFCAFFEGNPVSAGFYSLSFSALNSKFLLGQDADIYSDGAPFIYIDWLAVNRPLQNNGIGKFLLMNALRRAYEVSTHVALYGVALRSLSDKTTKFYGQFGFVVREKENYPVMIVPMATLRDLMGPVDENPIETAANSLPTAG